MLDVQNTETTVQKCKFIFDSKVIIGNMILKGSFIIIWTTKDKTYHILQPKY